MSDIDRDLVGESDGCIDRDLLAERDDCLEIAETLISAGLGDMAFTWLMRAGRIINELRRRGSL